MIGRTSGPEVAGAPLRCVDLQAGIRELRQDDMPLPTWQGAAFEVIEAEFVLEFLIC